MQNRNLSKIAGALIAAGLFSAEHPALALEISPYFHAWSNDVLTQSKRVAGLDAATLAFGITKGTCALEPDLLEKLPDMRAYIGLGGQLTISMGGQNGVYVAIACDDDPLFNLIDNLIVNSGTLRIGWDIEGGQLLDLEGTARRTRILLRLQAKYPDLYTTFTLPGWLRGVDVNGMDLLKTTIDAGVRISMINVMTMSFGVENLKTLVVPSTVAQASIMTFRATVNQIATLYPNKTQEQLHAMMGMTPMIGKNDDGSIFSLDEAKIIADFAKANGIGMLSYWSFQRDRAQATNASNNLASYSGVAQTDYQFLNVFKTATGSPMPTPDPVCSNVPWVQKKQYAVGSIVRYSNGIHYIAKFANPGYEPTISTYYWSPYSCSVTAPPPSAWMQGKQYAVGSVVEYSNGKLYKANFANPGYEPTISTYYWSPYGSAVTPPPPPAWMEGKQYAVGNVVEYSNGKLYKANFANPGYEPTISTYYWSPYSSAVTPPPPPTCSSSTWTEGKQYAAGSVVKYSNGNLYQANSANPGYNPTISSYYWSRYVC